MNETICNIMLFGGIALAVVFAVVAVILFVKLDIPKVIGDLSGSTARKQIREIREKGYESVQGSGASKKDAIKSKDSTGKIEVRDIKRKTSRSEELEKKGNERYQKAVNELKKEQQSRMDEFERETDKGFRTIIAIVIVAFCTMSDKKRYIDELLAQGVLSFINSKNKGIFEEVLY